MDFDVLLHKLADDKGWSLLYVTEDDLYKLTLPVPGERYQDVYVAFRRDAENWNIATIWTVISEVEDFNLDQPTELLRFNWRTLYGSLAIKDEQIVLVQNQLTEEANWNEVGRAVAYMALTADGIEQEIYGDEDKN
jgi:hypothetical protein